MKLRVFFVALILVVLASAAYLWLAPSGVVAPVVPSRTTPSSANQPSTTVNVPASSRRDLPAATPESALPPVPVQTNSAVVAGQPMVRTTPAPTPPPAANAAPAGIAPAAQKAEIADEKQDLENVRRMFGDYRTRMGENPVGSNAEIMKKVMGDNPVGARLGPPEGQSINAEGELVDRWGTAYFFHQLAADKMEIRSAGPDKRMWTADDVVTK